MNDTYIIAEAAATHDGELTKAIELVAIAKTCGADAVKFQWSSDVVAMATRRHLDDHAVYRLLNFNRDWLQILADTAHAMDMDFMCTVFLPLDIPVIAPLVDSFKVSSLDSFDFPFLLAHEGYGKEIIVSTGCHDETTRRALIHWTGRWHRGETHTEYRLLHCIAAYPCRMEDLNLQWLCDHPLDGLSDHTGNVLTGALAAMTGAEILEVHVKHEATLEDNPDFRHSLTPPDLHRYIENVRLAETVFGDSEDRVVLPCEEPLVKHRVMRAIE